MPFEDSLRTPVPRARKARQQWQSGTLEVPAQRSDTEELLWKLYDLSCCCQSGPRRKATRNARNPPTRTKRRKRREKNQEYINRCKNTKPPNQNRNSPYDLGHIILKQFGQVVEPLLVKKKNGACQSMGWCPPVLGMEPAVPWTVARGGCPLSCGPDIPAMPLVRTPVTTWLISHRTTRVGRVYLS